MCLEVGLLEPLAGPAGQHPRPVGVQAEEGGDLARGLALDLGVPEHRLPPLRQRAERPHRQRLLGLVHRPDVGGEFQGAVVRPAGSPGRLLDEDDEVVDQLLPAGRPDPPGRGAADGGEQIGADRVPGPGTAAHRLQHPGEHLGGEVVGGVRVPAAGAGVSADRVGVPAVEGLVGGVVPGPHPRDQRGVGTRGSGAGGLRGAAGLPLHGKPRPPPPWRGRLGVIRGGARPRLLRDPPGTAVSPTAGALVVPLVHAHASAGPRTPVRHLAVSVPQGAGPAVGPAERPLFRGVSARDCARGSSAPGTIRGRAREAFPGAAPARVVQARVVQARAVPAARVRTGVSAGRRQYGPALARPGLGPARPRVRTAANAAPPAGCPAAATTPPPGAPDPAGRARRSR